jgi:hypothetical protein
MTPDRKWYFSVWWSGVVSYLAWWMVIGGAEKFVSKMLAKNGGYSLKQNALLLLNSVCLIL